MLSLGDADCILVSKWSRGMVTRVLIDGGERHHAARVKRFLRRRRALFIDHVVCSHLHTDHAAGLIELVNDPEIEVGCGWVHKPRENIDEGTVQILEEAVAEGRGERGARFLLESLQTQQELLDALEGRGVDIEQPFAGRPVGFLTVHSPTGAYYRRMLRRFRNYDQLVLLEQRLSRARGVIDALLDEGFALSDHPTTTPENEASTVLSVNYVGGKFLFTSDAGVGALNSVQEFDLSDCAWMQIPHHGSHNNITPALVEYFRPEVAFVSADGLGHPHDSVIEAFKRVGATVLSTHSAQMGCLRHEVGYVPRQPRYRHPRPL